MMMMMMIIIIIIIIIDNIRVCPNLLFFKELF